MHNRHACRALSTESRSLGDSLTLLMAPVMDIIATATARAYLAADVVSNALEFLSSLVHLLPSSPHSDTGVSSRAFILYFPFMQCMHGSTCAACTVYTY